MLKPALNRNFLYLMQKLLDRTEDPLSFIVFVPDWRDPPTNALKMLEASKWAGFYIYHHHSCHHYNHHDHRHYYNHHHHHHHRNHHSHCNHNNCYCYIIIVRPRKKEVYIALSWLTKIQILVAFFWPHLTAGGGGGGEWIPSDLGRGAAKNYVIWHIRKPCRDEDSREISILWNQSGFQIMQIYVNFMHMFIFFIIFNKIRGFLVSKSFKYCHKSI